MDPKIRLLSERLKKAFETEKVDIHDFSSDHKGHLPGPQHGATHLEISIVSKLFDGKNRLQRQRLVHEVLRDELATGELHAVALKLRGTED